MPTFSSFNSLGQNIQTAEIDDDAITDAKIAAAAKGTHLIFFPTIVGRTVGSGTWSYVTSSTTRYGSQMNNGAGPINTENISYNVWIPEGTYTLYAINHTSNARAILKIDFDGTTVHTVDCYAAAGSDNVVSSTTGISVTSSKVVTVKFKSDGKNGASTGYQINTSGFILVRE